MITQSSPSSKALGQSMNARVHSINTGNSLSQYCRQFLQTPFYPVPFCYLLSCQISLLYACLHQLLFIVLDKSVSLVSLMVSDLYALTKQQLFEHRCLASLFNKTGRPNNNRHLHYSLVTTQLALPSVSPGDAKKGEEVW